MALDWVAAQLKSQDAFPPKHVAPESTWWLAEPSTDALLAAAQSSANISLLAATSSIEVLVERLTALSREIAVSVPAELIDKPLRFLHDIRGHDEDKATIEDDHLSSVRLLYRVEKLKSRLADARQLLRSLQDWPLRTKEMDAFLRLLTAQGGNNNGGSIGSEKFESSAVVETSLLERLPEVLDTLKALQFVVSQFAHNAEFIGCKKAWLAAYRQRLVEACLLCVQDCFDTVDVSGCAFLAQAMRELKAFDAFAATLVQCFEDSVTKTLQPIWQQTQHVQLSQCIEATPPSKTDILSEADALLVFFKAVTHLLAEKSPLVTVIGIDDLASQITIKTVVRAFRDVNHALDDESLRELPITHREAMLCDVFSAIAAGCKACEQTDCILSAMAGAGGVDAFWKKVGPDPPKLLVDTAAIHLRSITTQAMRSLATDATIVDKVNAIENALQRSEPMLQALGPLGSVSILTIADDVVSSLLSNVLTPMRHKFSIPSRQMSSRDLAQTINLAVKDFLYIDKELSPVYQRLTNNLLTKATELWHITTPYAVALRASLVSSEPDSLLAPLGASESALPTAALPFPLSRAAMNALIRQARQLVITTCNRKVESLVAEWLSLSDGNPRLPSGVSDGDDDVPHPKAALIGQHLLDVLPLLDDSSVAHSGGEESTNTAPTVGGTTLIQPFLSECERSILSAITQLPSHALSASSAELRQLCVDCQYFLRTLQALGHPAAALALLVNSLASGAWSPATTSLYDLVSRALDESSNEAANPAEAIT